MYLVRFEVKRVLIDKQKQTVKYHSTSFANFLVDTDNGGSVDDLIDSFHQSGQMPVDHGKYRLALTAEHREAMPNRWVVIDMARAYKQLGYFHD